MEYHDARVKSIPDTELSMSHTRCEKAPLIDPFHGNDPHIAGCQHWRGLQYGMAGQMMKN